MHPTSAGKQRTVVRQAKDHCQASKGQSGKQRTVVRQARDCQASKGPFPRPAKDCQASKGLSGRQRTVPQAGKVQSGKQGIVKFSFVFKVCFMVWDVSREVREAPRRLQKNTYILKMQFH